MNVAGGDLNWIGTLNDSSFQQSLRRMEQGVNRTTSGILSQGNAIESYANKASQAVAAFFSVQAATGFVSSLVDIRSQFQQLDIAFSTMLKSKVAADVLMKELIVFAGATPFGLKDAAGAAKQLLAYGSTAKTVIGELRMLGDVASGVSVPIGDLVYLYGTLKTQGRAYAMDIRQFAGRGIPIYAELAKVLRINKDEVAGFVEAGKVGFPQVEQAFKNMTSTAGIFGGLMEAQSKTWKGQIERFKDAWDVMLNDIGKGQEGIFSLGIDSATSFVTNYKQVLDILGLLIYSYGAYRAALIAYTVAEVIATNSVVVHGLAVRQLTTMETIQAAGKRLLISLQTTYNAVLAASPIGATVVLLAALGAVIYSLSQYMSAAEATQERFNSIQEESGLSANKEARNIKALVDVIKSQVSTNEQRESAYKRLQETTKGVLIGFSQEEIAAGKATTAIQGYIKSIQDAAVARSAFSEFQKLNDQLAELEVKGVGAISMMDRAALRAKGLGAYLGYQISGVPDANKGDFANSQAIAGFGGDANKAIVNNQKKNLQAQLDALTKKYNKQITAELTKTTPEDESNAAPKVRSVDAIDKDIKKLKEEQDAVSTTSKQYQNYQKQIDALNREKTAITGKETAANKKQISDRQKFLDELVKIEDEATRKGLTKDQEEIKAAQDKAEALRVEARKKGLGAGVITRIDNVEIRETGDLNYRQNTEKLKTQLDEEKKLYDEYEDYKLTLGKEKADERFKNERDLSLTYLEELKIREGELQSKGVANLTGPEAERLKLIKERILTETESEKKKYDDLVKEYVSYSDQRKQLTERYNSDIAKLEDNPEAKAARTLVYKEDIKSLDDANVQKLDAYKELFKGVDRLSDENAKKVTANAATMLENLLKSGQISAELAAEIKKLINDSNKSIEDRLPEKLIDLANKIDAVAQSVDGVSVAFGDVLRGVSSVIGNVGNLKKAFADMNKEGATANEKFAAGADIVAIGVGAATNLMGIFMNSAKERKKAEEDYYASVLKFQNDYNLSLNEEIRLKTQISDNVFVKDLKGRITDGTAALADAQVKYEKSLRDLQEGRAKLGQRNAIDPKNLIGGAASGAVLGATIGSVVPVIGTAIGAVVGGIAGLIGGLFGGKKKKDVFGGLLSEYPELIKQSGEFNEALAKNLIANNLVDEKTKALLQNTIDLAEARKAAIEQINSVITELAGDLGNNLRNSLVDAFKNGEDSAVAFGKTVEGVIENIISQMLFAAVFGDSLDELQKQMKASFEVGGDQSFIDDITKFYQQAGPSIKAFNEGMEAAKTEAAKNGLDIFGGGSSKSSETMPGQITSITMAQADKLSGLFNGFRIAQFETNTLMKSDSKVNQMMLDNAIANLDIAMKTERNTFRTADNTEPIKDIKKSLESIDKKMDNGANALAGTGRKVI